jgi:hypothetical protein
MRIRKGERKKGDLCSTGGTRRSMGGTRRSMGGTRRSMGGTRSVASGEQIAARRARKAKNQAKWRRDADKGAMVCPVLVTRALLDWLIDDIAWVPKALAGNRRHEIGKAITEGLAEAAPSPLRRTQSC